MSPWDCQVTLGRGASPRLWLGLTGQGEGQACHWIGEGWGGGDQSTRGTARCPFPSPPQSPPAFVSFQKLAWGRQTGQQKQLSSEPLPPVGFSHVEGEWGRELLPFSQCLRCAPSGPPGAWDSLLPDVTGLRSQRGCLPPPPSSWKGIEWEGVGLGSRERV